MTRATLPGLAVLIAALLAPAGTWAARPAVATYAISISGTQKSVSTETTEPTEGNTCGDRSTTQETITFRSVRPTVTRIRRGAAGDISTAYLNRSGRGQLPGDPLRGEVDRRREGAVVCVAAQNGEREDCGTKPFSNLRVEVNNLAVRGSTAAWNLMDIDATKPLFQRCEISARKEYPSLFDRRIQADQFGRFFVAKVAFAKLFNPRTRRFTLRLRESQRFRDEGYDSTLTIAYTLTFVRRRG